MKLLLCLLVSILVIGYPVDSPIVGMNDRKTEALRNGIEPILELLRQCWDHPKCTYLYPITLFFFALLFSFAIYKCAQKRKPINGQAAENEAFCEVC
ncbi:unnamed protein product, partial [Mesorhabditis belari]|uniref:Uncharacterized protein n=1 Tax=Mesorhabditis belari TaxID=2138241 RepID=A0AAF3FE92_9BILA